MSLSLCRRHRAALALALATMIASPAWAQDFWVNPGTMGANALPVHAGELPQIDTALTFRVTGAVQRTIGGDASAVPSYRLAVPFRRWGELICEGRPIEWWRVAPRTAEDWHLAHDAGLTGGDISFGAKFLVWDGGASLPAVAARIVTKSTTGKGFWDRRFTNAPAYLLDLVGAWPVVNWHRTRLFAAGTFGFFAWQQGENGQNDAPAWSGSMRAAFADGSSAAVEVRGYDGWETDDKALVVAAEGEWAFSRHVGLFGAVAWGLVDQPLIDAQLGFVLRVGLPVPGAN